MYTVPLLEMFEDNAGLFSQWLSVPVHLVLDVGVVVALEGLGQDASWLVLRLCSLIKRRLKWEKSLSKRQAWQERKIH